MDKAESAKKRTGFHYAWVILFAMCIIRSLSAAGINNTGGLFLTPVSAALGVGVGTVSIYFSISSVASFLFMPVAGRLVHRYSIKLLIIAAVILQAGSFAALGFMRSVWGWYVLSVPMGIGGAVLVNLAGPILINRWFKNNTGTALGIMMACMGLFGAFIQPLTLRMIGGVGWEKTYILLGGGIAVITLLFALLLLKSSPRDMGLQPLETKQKSDEKPSPTAGPSVALGRAMKSSAFYLLLFFMVSLTAFGAFSQHMAPYGQSLGYGSGQMEKILSIGMIGSTVGAILIGVVSDKAGAFKTTMAIIGGVAAAIICLALGGHSYWIFMLGSFLLGLSAMGIPVLAPLLTSAFFGGKDYESIYANVMMGPPFASVVMLPLYGYFFDLKGNYNLALILLGVFALAGAICITAGWRAKDKLSKA